MVVVREKQLKWMMTGGNPIYGNHIDVLFRLVDIGLSVVNIQYVDKR